MIVGNSGKIYQVPPRAFAPFDMQFAQGRLFFMDDDPMLVDCLGSCSTPQVLEMTESIHSESDLQRIQLTIGRRKYDARLTGMLQRLLTNFAQRPAEASRIPLLGMLPDPPQHIWTFPAPDVRQDTWEWQEPATRIRKRKLTVSHLDNTTNPIQDKTVCEIKVK